MSRTSRTSLLVGSRPHFRQFASRLITATAVCCRDRDFLSSPTVAHTGTHALPSHIRIYAHTNTFLNRIKSRLPRCRAAAPSHAQTQHHNFRWQCASSTFSSTLELTNLRPTKSSTYVSLTVLHSTCTQPHRRTTMYGAACCCCCFGLVTALYYLDDFLKRLVKHMQQHKCLLERYVSDDVPFEAQHGNT